MSTNIPNVAKKDKSLRQTVEEIVGTTPSTVMTDGDYGDVRVSSGGTVMRVEAASDIIFLQNTATATQIQAALDSLTSGGVVQLAAGTYTLSAPLSITKPNVTLRGANQQNTVLLYTSNANLDILTIAHGGCHIEDLSIYGAASPANGAGQVGTGCGIKVAVPTATLGSDNFEGPWVSRVGIYSTPCWCFCDTGVAVADGFPSGNLTYGAAGATSSGMALSVHMHLNDVTLAFPNSGGALYIGSGATACRISGLKTNSYSFGLFGSMFSSTSAVTANKGAVHLYNVFNAVFDNKCVFQSPVAQTGTPAVAHDDTDATMVSLQHSATTSMHSPYFEILSGTVAGGAVGPTAAGRTKYFFELINASNLYVNGALFQSYGKDSGTPVPDGYPLRILHTPDGDIGDSVWFKDCVAYQYRLWYSAGDGRPASAPYGEGDFITWDRDDFVFEGDRDGTLVHPINIEDFIVRNFSSGNTREVTTPAAGGGAAIVNALATRFSTNNRNINFGKWQDNDLTGGAGTMDDMRVRSALAHTLAAGNFAYSAGGSGRDGAVQREGLWGISTRGNDFRQVPWIRIHTSAWPDVYAGDLWMQTGAPVAGVYTTAQFKWYDGSAWQAPLNRSIGTAAGDIIYYTASDTPARLAKNNNNNVLTLVSGLPSWQPGSQNIVVDGSGGIVTNAGTVVVN